MVGGITTTAPDGRRATCAVAGPYEITALSFPAGYRLGWFSPDRGYVVVPLEGAVCKTFFGDTATISADTVSTLPAAAAHSSVFGPAGTRVLIVRSAGEEVAGLETLLTRRRHHRVAASTHLARRISRELGAGDAGTTLALEGLVLQLLAVASRDVLDVPRRSAGWLAAVREILDAETPARLSLTELGARVGRSPAHLARAFRREYGVTVASYARTSRLEWAREQLIASDTAITAIAVAAGYVDQSHFTRAFHRFAGITPARFRDQSR